MTVLAILSLLIVLAIALRVMLFERRQAGTDHRPVAAALAYLIVLAAGGLIIAQLFNLGTLHQVCQLILNLLFLLALLASGGNVVDLFRSTSRPHNLITRILRGYP